MARISLTPPRTLLVRLGDWYSRRTYGKVLEPGMAVGHHGRILYDYAKLERSVAKWRALDPVLKHLAVMASAARINCSWCMDYGYWLGSVEGIDLAKISRVSDWREATGVFSPLERSVMAYAEAMTETEPQVTDELAAELIAALGEKAFVELTMMVAIENLRSRVNSAFGLTSQGFSEACSVPPPGPRPRPSGRECRAAVSAGRPTGAGRP